MPMNPWLMAGLGGLGTYGMFNQENPADAAMPYFNQIPGQIKPYYEPYIEAGQRARPGLENQYGMLANDPGGRLNQIGQGYHQSPGFQFALQQALQGSNQASAAGGMGGSPQNMQQNMGLATNLANQDYDQWLNHALGLYGTGLQGQQGMYNTGYNASNELGQSLANNLMSQGSLAFQGQANQNKGQNDMWGGLASLGLRAFGL